MGYIKYEIAYIIIRLQIILFEKKLNPINLTSFLYFP
jgi:hypothetical protein